MPNYYISMVPDSGDYGGGPYPAVIGPNGPAFGPCHFLGMLRCQLWALLHGHGLLEVRD